MKTQNGSYLQQFSKNLQLILLPKHIIEIIYKIKIIPRWVTQLSCPLIVALLKISSDTIPTQYFAI